MYNSLVYPMMVAAAMAAGGKYHYRGNGVDWGMDTPLCDEGRQQSPIDLHHNGARSDNLYTDMMGYQNFSAEEVDPSENQSHTVMFKDNDYAIMEYTCPKGKSFDYAPLQLHFHAPSEHTVHGRHYDLEVHIVHLLAGSDDITEGAAVVGVFFDRVEGGDYENEFLQSFINSTGEESGDSQVRIDDFVSGLNFDESWAYYGSLTTPPCLEGLNWQVLMQVQSISQEQLDHFTRELADNWEFAEGKGNNRRVQPMHERELYIRSYDDVDMKDDWKDKDDDDWMIWEGAVQNIAYGAVALGAAITLAF